MKDALPAILVIAALVGLFIGVPIWLDNASCSSTARAIQMAYTWGPLQGCVVEYKPGKWILLKNYKAGDIETTLK